MRIERLDVHVIYYNVYVCDRICGDNIYGIYMAYCQYTICAYLWSVYNPINIYIVSIMCIYLWFAQRGEPTKTRQIFASFVITRHHRLFKCPDFKAHIYTTINSIYYTYRFFSITSCALIYSNIIMHLLIKFCPIQFLTSNSCSKCQHHQNELVTIINL